MKIATDVFRLVFPSKREFWRVPSFKTHFYEDQGIHHPHSKHLESTPPDRTGAAAGVVESRAWPMTSSLHWSCIEKYRTAATWVMRRFQENPKQTFCPSGSLSCAGLEPSVERQEVLIKICCKCMLIVSSLQAEGKEEVGFRCSDPNALPPQLSVLVLSGPRQNGTGNVQLFLNGTKTMTMISGDSPFNLYGPLHAFVVPLRWLKT